MGAYLHLTVAFIQRTATAVQPPHCLSSLACYAVWGLSFMPGLLPEHAQSQVLLGMSVSLGILEHSPCTHRTTVHLSVCSHGSTQIPVLSLFGSSYILVDFRTVCACGNEFVCYLTLGIEPRALYVTPVITVITAWFWFWFNSY